MSAQDNLPPADAQAETELRQAKTRQLTELLPLIETLVDQRRSRPNRSTLKTHLAASL
jgi:hypothetical protein